MFSTHICYATCQITISMLKITFIGSQNAHKWTYNMLGTILHTLHALYLLILTMLGTVVIAILKSGNSLWEWNSSSKYTQEVCGRSVQFSPLKLLLATTLYGLSFSSQRLRLSIWCNYCPPAGECHSLHPSVLALTKLMTTVKIP